MLGIRLLFYNRFMSISVYSLYLQRLPWIMNPRFLNSRKTQACKYSMHEGLEYFLLNYCPFYILLYFVKVSYIDFFIVA